ncbi:MAG TPA: hypothetical protein PKI62_14240 [bacterium]|nr:hypothetical protein [bacterium]HPR89127.1 hypothetical protein [bacterium]
MKKLLVVVMFCMLLPATMVLAQKTDGVHLFQNFFSDAVVATNPYGEAGLGYNSYDGFSAITAGAQGGYPVNEKLEVGVGVHYMNFSYDQEGVDSQGGLADPYVGVRYQLTPGPTKFAVGGYATLPVGSEDIGQGNLNFGAFGAVRHQLDQFTLTGTVGLNFYEVKTYEDSYFDFDKMEVVQGKEKTEHKNYISLGVGGIYPVNKNLAAVGELVMHTEGDFMMLSAGLDYNMGNVRYRGGLGLGLDDGAPDLSIFASYMLNF